MGSRRLRRWWVPAAALSLFAVACSDGGGDPLGGGLGGGAVDAGPGAAGSAAFAQEAPAATTSAAAIDPGVTVTGVGRVQGRPDTLRATVGVEAERDSVSEALEAANAATEAVLAALRDAGVADRDLQTVQFSVNPRYVDTTTGIPEISGYVVGNLVEATVREIGRAGDVLQAAVTAGGDAARVQGITFALEDNAALVDAARESAFADARRKAEQYAALAGRELGPLVGLSEVVADPPQPDEFRAAAEGGADVAASVPLQPGRQEVGVTVTAVWSLS